MIATKAFVLMITLASGELPPARYFKDPAPCARAVRQEAARQPAGSTIVCMEFPSTNIIAYARNRRPI